MPSVNDSAVMQYDEQPNNSRVNDSRYSDYPQVVVEEVPSEENKFQDSAIDVTLDHEPETMVEAEEGAQPQQ